MAKLRSAGAQRRTLIVFYKRAELVSTEPEDEQSSPELRFFARASWVFNAAQVDGYVPPVPEARSEVEAIQEVEAFVEAVGATVIHGQMACYRRKSDVIEMPRRDRFIGSGTSSPTESYYATLLHELTHWSGAAHRLNRTFGKRHGDEAYAMEELVAELGAAFLCAMLGITSEPRTDHAAYVASWLKVLRRRVGARWAVRARIQRRRGQEVPFFRFGG